jgi:hypothetical protein
MNKLRQLFKTMAAYLISISFIVFIAYLTVPGSCEFNNAINFKIIFILFLAYFSWHPFLMSLGVCQ